MTSVHVLLALFFCGAATAFVSVAVYRIDLGHQKLWYLATLVVSFQVVLFVLGSGPPVYIEGFGATPLSVAVFPVNLVLILLGYAKKGIYELRRVVFGYIVAANLVLCAASLLSGVSFGCTTWLGVQAAKLGLFALGLVVIDAFVMVFVYDTIPKGVTRIVRIGVPLVLALLLDAFGYSFGLQLFFAERFPDAGSLYPAQLLAKFGAAVGWAIVLERYAHWQEPDLFNGPPAPPNGLAFALRLLKLKKNEALLRPGPLRVETGIPLADAADQFDQLLGEVVVRRWGGAAAVAVRRPSSAAPATGWPEQTSAAIAGAVRGRVNGFVANAEDALLLVLYSADGDRLTALVDELMAEFAVSPGGAYLLLSAGGQPPERESGHAIVNRLLGGSPVTAPVSTDDPDGITREAIATLASQWPALSKQFPGKCVAYYGRKRLGFDRRPYRLYDRYVTVDRPAATLLIVRIDDELSQSFPELRGAPAERE